MQRNMNLIRQILLGIESAASTRYDFAVEGVDDLDKWYNIDLLVQANLIQGVEVHWASDGTGPYCHIRGLVALTWEGHDFLDAVRDDSVWEQATEKARTSGLDMQGLTFDVIKSLCVATAKHILGL